MRRFDRHALTWDEHDMTCFKNLVLQIFCHLQLFFFSCWSFSRGSCFTQDTHFNINFMPDYEDYDCLRHEYFLHSFFCLLHSHFFCVREMFISFLIQSLLDCPTHFFFFLQFILHSWVTCEESDWCEKLKKRDQGKFRGCRKQLRKRSEGKKTWKEMPFGIKTQKIEKNKVNPGIKLLSSLLLLLSLHILSCLSMTGVKKKQYMEKRRWRTVWGFVTVKGNWETCIRNMTQDRRKRSWMEDKKRLNQQPDSHPETRGEQFDFLPVFSS